MVSAQKVSGQKVSGHKVSRNDSMCQKVSSQKVSKTYQWVDLEKSPYNMSAEGASEFFLQQSYRITCKYYNEIIFFSYI